MNPGAADKTRVPQSVLFLCGMNAIRSPMAEALARQILPSRVFLASAGLRAGERDEALQAYADTVLTALSEVETALAVEEFLSDTWKPWDENEVDSLPTGVHHVHYYGGGGG